MSSKPRYMRFDEVAGELGYKSRGPIYRLAEAGDLAMVPVGGTHRITRESFDAYCARIETEGAKRPRRTA